MDTIVYLKKKDLYKNIDLRPQNILNLLQQNTFFGREPTLVSNNENQNADHVVYRENNQTHTQEDSVI